MKIKILKKAESIFSKRTHSFIDGMLSSVDMSGRTIEYPMASIKPATVENAWINVGKSIISANDKFKTQYMTDIKHNYKK